MRLTPSLSPYLERMTEPGGDRAALVALLRVRPDRLTRPGLAWPDQESDFPIGACRR